MPTIQEIRQKFPQYNDLSDQQLLDSLYQKYYSDLPRAQFNQMVGAVPGGPGTAAGAVAGSVPLSPIDRARMSVPLSPIDRARMSFESRGGLPGFAERADSAVRSFASRVPVLGAMADRADPRPEQDARFREANPGMDTALGVAGSVLGTAAMMGLAPGLFGVAAGQSMPARVGLGMASGALLGGADASIRSPNDPWGALKTGAAVGGGLGALIPVAAPLFGRMVVGATDAAKRITPTGRATATFREAAQADRFNPAAFRAAPAERMVMDSGENLQKLGRGIAAEGGTGQDILRAAMERRATEALALRQDLSAQAKQVFEPMLAQARPVNTKPALYNLDAQIRNTANPDAKRVLEGYRQMILDAGNDASRLHEVQSIIGEDIRSYFRSAVGSERGIAGKLRIARDQLVNNINMAAGGQYRTAQKEYAAALERIEAIAEGEPAGRAIKAGLTASATKRGRLGAAVQRVQGLGLELGVPAITGAQFGWKPAAVAAGAMLARRGVLGAKAASDRARNAAMARMLVARPGEEIPTLGPANQQAINLAIQRLLTGANVGLLPKLSARP